MKQYTTAIILFLTILLYSQANAAKSPIIHVHVQQNKISDLYKWDHTPIQLKITRADASVEYTVYGYEGTFRWSKIKITSSQATLIKSRLHINREALRANKNVIDMGVQIIEKRDTFFKDLKIELPKIKKVSILLSSITPYQPFSPQLRIETEEKDYYIDTKRDFLGLRYAQFVWKTPPQMVKNGNIFIYEPMDSIDITDTWLMVRDTVMNVQGFVTLPVKQLKEVYINYTAPNGPDGMIGEDGLDGSLGEHGGHGAGGWNAGDGYDGTQVEALLRQADADEYELVIFAQNTIKTYRIPLYATVHINIQGGNGGAGGVGGNGGSGGGSTEEYEAGEDGSGGPGGNGGNGGVGGSFKIFTDVDVQTVARIFEINIQGGKGGRGGEGGYGSPSGTGGKPEKNGDPGQIDYSIISSKELKNLFHQLVK